MNNKPENGTEIQALVTTKGRKTGVNHTTRVRIYYWNGRIIAMSPYPRPSGKTSRDWVQNVMKNPEVTIKNADVVANGTGKIVGSELELKRTIAMYRISWRGPICPTVAPDTDTYVEFFLNDHSTEDLFVETTHTPSEHSLAADSFDGIKKWESSGNRYQRQERSHPPWSDEERKKLNEQERALRTQRIA